MSRAGHQPKLFWLAGCGEVPDAIVYRYGGVAGLVNNQQRPGADFANDVHGAHTTHVNVRSEIGDADRYWRKWKGGKMNEVFKAASDDAEPGII